MSLFPPAAGPEDAELICHAGLAAVSRSLRFAFAMILVLMSSLLLWYLTLGGYFTVGPQERVLVLRFGRPVAEHRDGWHWAFPAPVHELVRVPTSQRTIQVASFWPANLPATAGAAPDSAARPNAPLKPGIDGYLLTGDANIICTVWTLNYQVTDATVYYRRCLGPADPRKADEVQHEVVTHETLGLRGPETMLRHLLENAIIHETAQQPIDAALYQDSATFNTRVAQRMVELVRARELGLEVLAVVLTDKTVPGAVQDSFQEVVSAMQQSSTGKLIAQREATQALGQARADAAHFLSAAESYRKRVVTEVAAESAYFRRILDEFRANPATVLFSLYTDTLAAVLPSATDKYIIRTNDRGHQEVRVQLNAEPVSPQPGGGT